MGAQYREVYWAYSWKYISKSPLYIRAPIYIEETLFSSKFFSLFHTSPPSYFPILHPKRRFLHRAVPDCKKSYSVQIFHIVVKKREKRIANHWGKNLFLVWKDSIFLDVTQKCFFDILHCSPYQLVSIEWVLKTFTIATIATIAKRTSLQK